MERHRQQGALTREVLNGDRTLDGDIVYGMALIRRHLERHDFIRYHDEQYIMLRVKEEAHVIRHRTEK